MNCSHKKCFDFCKNKLMDESSIKFVKLDKISKQTEDEYLLRFNLPINHDPGQFMQVSILGIGEAPISFCSYNKKYFEMSVRSVGNVSAHICKLKKGDLIGLRGPYGRGYPMEHFHGDNIIVIAGGSGVAPVRGIIEYLTQKREKFLNINLFFGFRTIHNMLFEQDYKKWRELKINLEIVIGEKSSNNKFKYGFVTEYLDVPCLESNNKKIIFVCGPPIMIESTVKILLEKGFNKDQIYISQERHMKCAVGRCGHCMIEDKYCCTDGPVFRYDEIEGYQG